MTIAEIIEQYLKDNGYDGLYCDFCGCKIGDLMPCGEDCSACEAGYFQELDDLAIAEGYDFVIGKDKNKPIKKQKSILEL